MPRAAARERRPSAERLLPPAHEAPPPPPLFESRGKSDTWRQRRSAPTSVGPSPTSVGPSPKINHLAPGRIFRALPRSQASRGYRPGRGPQGHAEPSRESTSRQISRPELERGPRPARRREPEGADKKGKGPKRLAFGPLEKIPATSYSPTRLPVQYHRLRRA